MIFDEDEAPPPAASGWLARARAQSRELAEARARRAEQIARAWTAPRAHRKVARQNLALALAGIAVLLLVASGAWALVSRATREPPRPPTPPPTVSAPAPLPPRTAVVTPEPKSIARPRKTKLPPVAPIPPAPSPPPGPVKFDEGDAEIILVAPHDPQPPLFSPEEWKRRR